MTALVPWQQLLKQGVSQVDELLSLLQLTPSDLPALDLAPHFKLRVPRGFIARMQAKNPQDPLLLQILPLAQENIEVPGYSVDPLGEKQANPIPGLLHKYQSRVLLTLSGACAINCRYCFRRHFPYSDNNPGSQGWQKALEYIAQNTAINEVILSGGDPLTVPDNVLAKLAAQLADIAHVQTLRIHTRLPIVLPERIDATFLRWFSGTRLKPVMVLHSNHPQELDASVERAARALQEAGVLLLNQSVLLKGVNDEASVLAELSEKLFKFNILPYYLHLLDKVAGAAHFAVSREQALALYAQLRERLPGYLVPELVEEVASAKSKLLVTAY